MSFFSGNPFSWQNPLLTSQRVGNTNIKVPGASVFSGSAQSLTSSSPAAVIFTEEFFDNGDLFTLTDPTKITVKVAGVYSVVGAVVFASSSAVGLRELAIGVNGAGGSEFFVLDGSTSHGVACQVVAFKKLRARDYIEIIATQDSGGLLDLEPGGRSRMGLIWVSA